MFRWYPAFVRGPGALGLLLLRVVMGAAFILHGWPKIQHPLDWMGPTADMPGVLQALAAVAEFGGGAALVLGLLTPLAALGIACTMATALYKVHLNDPFVGAPGKPSKEFAAVYLAAALLFLIIGPGVLSLDALLARSWRRKG
jgi:putative oxidoreductase